MNKEFKIDCYKAKLVGDKGQRGIFDKDFFYTIPVYQRPYSWGEGELRRMFETICENIKIDVDEEAFMGTMQLSKNDEKNEELGDGITPFEIIDGQQRTTSLMMLRYLLQEKIRREEISDEKYDEVAKRYKTLVNRGSAQKDLNEFWDIWKKGRLHEECMLDNRNPYLRNVAIMNKLLEEYRERFDLSDDVLLVYIEQKLNFIVVETMAGLSKTLKIFNTINTAGMDLGTEDLFKLRLYDYLKENADRSTGDTDIFNQISSLYEQIDEYNRRNVCINWPFSMREVLETYQKIIIAQYNLPNETFFYSQETFFERLFDTLLKGFPKSREFENKGIKIRVEDISRVIKSLHQYKTAWQNNSQNKIMHEFIWETRYGRFWVLSAVALFFGVIEEQDIERFDRSLFKLLVPPSLYWDRIKYEVQNSLIEIMKSFSNQNNKNMGVNILSSCISANGLAKTATARWCFIEASMREIAYIPRAKKLTCRLVEYIKSDEKIDYHLLFEEWMDIEHIQPNTDPIDPDETQRVWGQELQRIGNLVMLEGGLNREIGNIYEKKRTCYERSGFSSVKDIYRNEPIGIHDKTFCWKKENAVKRRIELTKLLWEFLFNEKNIPHEYLDYIQSPEKS